MTHKASRIERIRLNAGGYTSRGQYYGTGERLYQVVITYKSTMDGRTSYVDGGFRFRATDFATAKARVRNALEAKPTQYAIQRALQGERSWWTHEGKA